MLFPPAPNASKYKDAAELENILKITSLHELHPRGHNPKALDAEKTASI